MPRAGQHTFRMRFSDDNRRTDPAYWRRRFFILGGGMATVAVLAWQFTPARPATTSAASATVRSSMDAAQSPDDLPSAAYGNAWPGPSATPSPSTPTPAVSPAATSSPKATASSAGPSGTPGQGASTSATASAGQCAAGGIVLSLFTSQASYSPGTDPQFDVYGVSTAAGACQMAFGPGSVRVIVTQHGQVVWDSAACKPAPAAPVRFQTGVPQLLTISWNRTATSPAGCAGSLPAGASGTFQAVAMSAGRDSSVRTFTLAR
jgi:hypothetical protein